MTDYMSIEALRKQGLSYQQIGARYGITKDAARGIHRRGLAKHDPVDGRERPDAGVPAADLPVAEPALRRQAASHPKGWEPGIVFDGKHGTITSRPVAEPTPDWDSLLRTWGFDPATVEIVDDTVQVRTWDAAVGGGETKTMWYYRAAVRQRRTGGPDIDALIDEVRTHAPRQVGQADPLLTISGAFVYCAADWQIGKQGTEAATARILASIDAAAKRYYELRQIGRQIDAIYLLGLGDLVEGCRDHYAQQTFTVELDNRAQVRLARRLIIKAVEVLAPLAPRLVVAGVGGNHGEERRDGKSYTTFADNKDVAVLESAAEVIAANPTAYGHVSFVIPEEQLTLTLDVAGAIVGIAHGHQARKGSNPQQRIQTWWRDQSFGRRPVGDADILISGHYHHFSALQDGPRTHLQAPTMDSGSQWWEETACMPSAPGALSFTIQQGRWDDLRLL